MDLGDVSDKQGERFCQDILTMKECYQGRLDQAKMGDLLGFTEEKYDIA